MHINRNDDRKFHQFSIEILFVLSTKRSIIGVDLNLLYAHRNGNAECNSGTQALINSLVWENGFTQVVDRPTRGDALLYVYPVRPESSFTASSIV